MASNHAQVTDGFRILREALAAYIARELHNTFGAQWWDTAVFEILDEDQRRSLSRSDDWSQQVDSLDVLACLTLFTIHWKNVFSKKLSIDHRTWATELKGVRNKVAHLGGIDCTQDYTWRALDTMALLAEQIDPDGAEEIRGMLRTSRYGSESGSAAVTEPSAAPSVATAPAPVVVANSSIAGILNTAPTSGLPCWRDVIKPHPDVAQGRYKNAEFAADLAQVARGEGALEYRDPVEFFARTYVTEGMTGLLEQSLRRVCGKDGDPVIQLKTAFGGGKTHSMLALYHLMRGKVPLDTIPNVNHVLQRAGVSSLPKTNVAVLVGTALDPSKPKRHAYLPGTTINTLWGHMAAQLAESAGNPKLYDIVKEADKKGVSPGSEALKELFDACAPSLVLMDELVAYAKKLYGANGLSAGTFDNFISFIQEVTEAARASKNSLVVASIPESDIEIGGDSGSRALETIEHTFGRMESIWKPVAANEGFEVVRRRLFLDCNNPSGRDAVCSRFNQLYNENNSDFPLEAREVEYRDRLISCYPIHPEVFDRLYEDWATLERFQRTRGVLRLMAAVIHELWMGSDASLMIMPGSIPLDVPNVRDELTRHLSEGWNALVDREVDGRNSIPYQKDQQNMRYGSKLASRRVARTVMLGSAPTVRDQNVRGIEASRIRLGVVQPGENIANFNDALNTLTSALAYLYTNPSGDRFWYDTRPTLRKTVEDRATQIAASAVEYEIETRLRLLRKEQPFAGIHICPSSSLDVPDEQTARLVILRPTDVYKASGQSCTAMTAAKDILNNRGNSPRIFRNMLSFIAPEQDQMTFLKQTVRLYLAWKSIREDSVDLNLDAAQNRETDNSLNRVNHTVDDQIKEAYCWLLVPYIDKVADMKTVVWDPIRISGGADGIITKAARKMLQNEQIVTKWAPALLLMELDNVLWKDTDHIAIKKLWEYLSAYCYLPRLANESVLMDAIQSGLNSTEYFVFASGFDGSRYIDLRFNQYVGIVERSGYLVKMPVALKQIADEEAKRQAEAAARAAKTGQTGTGAAIPAGTSGSSGTSTYVPPIGGHTTGHEINEPPVPTRPKNTRFFMSAPLDTTRIGRDVQKLVEEVISCLTSADGAQVEVSLEVNVQSPDGLSQDVVRTVSENLRTLRVQNFGFDE
ncbi:hypothetical protein FACS1894184_04510 [Clostridia bacterium]|nr:hypothetical protein FACS1894184_04510 [Clostridia bacterium]